MGGVCTRHVGAIAIFAIRLRNVIRIVFWFYILNANTHETREDSAISAEDQRPNG